MGVCSSSNKANKAKKKLNASKANQYKDESDNPNIPTSILKNGTANTTSNNLIHGNPSGYNSVIGASDPNTPSTNKSVANNINSDTK